LKEKSYLLQRTKKHFSLLISLLVIYTGVNAQAPSPEFSATPLSGCAPVQVSFTDLSSGSPTSWQWDLGNGAQSTQQNPTTTYFNPGTYTVSLTVSNASGTNSITKTAFITINSAPTVDFNASVTAGCFPVRTQFTDLSVPGSGNIVSWEWDFGDGGSSTAQNPRYVYANAGNFNVSLKVTNDRGCSKTISKIQFVRVSPGVRPNFLNSNPTTCGTPASINFNNLSSGPGLITYQWDFGDGNSSNGGSPTHIYNSPGVYGVTLIVSSSLGCVDTLTKPNLLSIGNITTNFTYPDTVCVNTQASFVNNSSPVPQSSVWDFADGTGSQQTDTVKTYTIPGTYNVKLINTYQFCTDSITLLITVLAKPVPDFTAPVTTSCQAPLTVNFQDVSVGAATWLWDFGDGTTSTNQNPSHTYTTPGFFNVRLIITNPFGCADTITKFQFVRIARPIVGINGLPANGCIPFTFQPTPNVISVDGVASYFWEFGDGTTSTAQNPTKIYTILGRYTVKLTITTNTGCIDSFKLVDGVKVGTPPTANYSLTPNPVCAFSPVQFTDLSAPADEWLWLFGDGSVSSLQNPTHAYRDTGRYVVTLVAYNSGCPDTFRLNPPVTVLGPVGRYNFSVNCTNKTQVNFTDDSKLPLTWLWDFGDGTTSTAQNPTHNFPALGTYTVSLTVTNGGCSHTITKSVELVDEGPDFQVLTDTLCRGGIGTFIANSFTPGNISNFRWYLGNGVVINSGTGSAASLSYPIPGIYTISLVSTDINGCIDSIAKPAVLKVFGSRADFNTLSSAACKNATVNFTDLSVTDGIHPITNWRWDFGDGTIQNFSAPPFTHTYTSNGIYTVKLFTTDSFGCLDSMVKTNFLTTPALKADFLTKDTITCPTGGSVAFTNKSSGKQLTYNWDFGDGNSSALPAPTYTYNTTGIFTVKLTVTDSLGCQDSLSKTNHIRVIRPIADFFISDTLSLCTPFQVSFSNASQNFFALAWDLAGQTSFTLNPSFTFVAPGNYDIQLIAVGFGLTCKDTITKRVVVLDTAGSRIDYTPVNGCTPQTVNFTATVPGPVSYIWDFDDGQTANSTSATISHVYTGFGNYTPKLIVVDPTGCNIPLTGSINIQLNGAVAGFEASDSIFCNSGTVQFTDTTSTNGTITGHEWSFGDGSTDFSQNPSHLYNTPGLYTVSLAVVTNTGCRDTVTKVQYIKVVSNPMIEVDGDSVVCPLDLISLNGLLLVPDTSAISWQWNFSGGQSSTLQNPPPVQYAAEGTYPFSVTAINSTGCKDTIDRNIIVNPLPTVTMPPSITIQAGNSTPIPAIYSPNTINFNWTPPGGLSCTGCPSPVASPKTTTTYNVLFTDDNGCRASDSIRIIIFCNDNNLYIPNTFSPNGDGMNDIFYPRGKGLARVRNMVIFNRWGQVVFERLNFMVNDPSAGWNGKFNGTKSNADVYTYIIEVVCENNNTIKYNGNISLIQ
jgi:gliding motility-associated-like protein